MHSNRKKQTWRDYQADLQKKTFLQTVAGFLPGTKSILILLITAAAATALYHGGISSFRNLLEKPEMPLEDPAGEDKARQMSKADVQQLLVGMPELVHPGKEFNLDSRGKQLHVSTNIDESLQSLAMTQFKRIRGLKRGKPKDVGMVAMDPDTGQVLMMAGFDIEDDSRITCVSNDFPAASLFKIVTATAAIEALNYNANSKIYYNGGKYTLYKSQLRDKKNRYTNRTTLKDSFAQSINPVFGKLGAKVVGKERLSTYADAYGFNRPIFFDLPVEKSLVTITEEPYQRAEIACGFNRNTMISPLHGAVMASLIANSGEMMEPILVSTIEDMENNPVYHSPAVAGKRVIKAETANELKKLMETTIRSGTGRKAFRGYRKDRVLSRLNLGGKTGSITNKSRDVKYDWFIGFAEEKKGNRKLAVSIVVGHRKYIGTRSSQFAKMIFRKYFDNIFSSVETASVKN